MKVKICGITQLVDAYLALELGAWALGFVFYPPSPRSIEPQKAGEIIAQLPSDVKTVGVFVNQSLEAMETIAEQSGINTFQLHGNETPELCQQLSLPVIKAFRLKHSESLNDLKTYCEVELEALLVDAAVAGEWGGTGQVANWELAREVKSMGPLILAGGLNPTNVLSAVQQVNPFALDLSSGVERSPGVKEPEKLQALFKALNKEKVER